MEPGAIIALVFGVVGIITTLVTVLVRWLRGLAHAAAKEAKSRADRIETQHQEILRQNAEQLERLLEVSQQLFGLTIVVSGNPDVKGLSSQVRELRWNKHWHAATIQVLKTLADLDTREKNEPPIVWPKYEDYRDRGD